MYNIPFRIIYIHYGNFKKQPQIKRLHMKLGMKRICIAMFLSDFIFHIIRVITSPRGVVLGKKI